MLDKYISYLPVDILANFTVVLTLLPLFLIVQRRAYVDPSFRLLLIYFILKFAADVAMFHYAANKVNNMIFYNITVLFRYLLLSGMFYYKFDRLSVKRLIIPFAIVFFVFTVWDIWYSNPDFYNFHDHRIVLYSMTIESLLMIFWTLLYFYEVIRSLKIPSLLTFPFFWVCSGLLLYYSSLIFIAPTLHYVFQWNKQLDIGFLDRIPYIFEIVSVILFSIGIWVFSARHYARQ